MVRWSPGKRCWAAGSGGGRSPVLPPLLPGGSGGSGGDPAAAPGPGVQPLPLPDGDERWRMG